jgi:hypothetical protein
VVAARLKAETRYFARRSCCAGWDSGRPGAQGNALFRSLSIPLDSEAADLSDQRAFSDCAAAAVPCGFDEGELAGLLMARRVMAATRIFDTLSKPLDQSHAEQDLSVLLNHFSSSFAALLVARPLQYSVNGLGCTAC